MNNNRSLKDIDISVKLHIYLLATEKGKYLVLLLKLIFDIYP